MSNKQEQEERLKVLLSDKRLLRQKGGTTYQERAMLDAALEHQGRFAALSKPSVTGATPVSYPKLPENNPFACDPVPIAPAWPSGR